ncbi:MAG: threonine synthase [Candidatus Dormibacteraeota bacterium]|uniref:Threonine synthase n=1 Tax=Candidatus Amunia macphersoniae TaxID=3127014 RepID=A0A934KEM9_9BACT|nr:threonine synthase [Candidatus Dormibacteraeota bacterium]
MAARQGVIARYAARLPITPATPRITLFEGETPSIPAPRLCAEMGLGSLHLKFEGLNPTGSFKDRGMVVAVARALEDGSAALVCASTGNTSASAAAYGARFGLRTLVVIPSGRISVGKLVQAQVHGAEILAIDGNFDVALSAVRSLAAELPVTLVNSVNPHRIEGQKTAAFEIVDDLGDAPEVVAIPVGNAGNITAYWRGFREYFAEGLCSRLPRMIGAQAAGAAPLVRGRPVADPDTVATAIRIGNPASWQGAIDARDQSEGAILAVDDADILVAQRDLAMVEGVFCEPASAASLAVLRAAVRDRLVAPGTAALCVLTGNGLKDLAVASEGLRAPVLVASDAASIAAALGLR